MPKQVSLVHFELVARFGPPKITKCFENGLLWDRQWVKKGSEVCFSNKDPRLFGVPKQVKGPLNEPLAKHYGPSEISRRLENG